MAQADWSDGTQSACNHIILYGAKLIGSCCIIFSSQLMSSLLNLQILVSIFCSGCSMLSETLHLPYSSTCIDLRWAIHYIVQQNHVLLAHSGVLCTVLAVACPILALEQQQQQIYSANTAKKKKKI